MRILAVVFLGILTSGLQSQSLHLAIPPGQSSAIMLALEDYKPKLQWLANDTLLLKPYSDSSAIKLLRILQAKSYLAASVDSLVQIDSLHWRANLYLGNPVYWVQIRTDPGDRNWLQAAGFRPKLYSGKPLQYQRFLQQREAVLQQAENNGFPFAVVSLDSLSLQPDGGAEALLQIERNKYVRFREIKINGDVRLPQAYLPAYLGIRPGAPYNASRVRQTPDRLRELLFVESTGPPSVRFSGDEATVNLALKKKRQAGLILFWGFCRNQMPPTGGC
ncbi:MAG: hypothetical protein IPL65_08695 [Lewinellaceae bacterium]|nr:hypothetical protein [Lewinellaceae bacterium]